MSLILFILIYIIRIFLFKVRTIVRPHILVSPRAPEISGPGLGFLAVSENHRGDVPVQGEQLRDQAPNSREEGLLVLTPLKFTPEPHRPGRLLRLVQPVEELEK